MVVQTPPLKASFLPYTQGSLLWDILVLPPRAAYVGGERTASTQWGCKEGSCTLKCGRARIH